MKISEVCRRTGLTERTVRYYEEEGFISPETTVSGGRTYRNYGEQDISTLETVASLRKLLFSIDEIKQMRDPEMIPHVLAGYRQRLTEMNQRMTDVLETLERMDMRYVDGINSLAKGFAVAAASRPLPPHDVTPNFGRFDEEETRDPDAISNFEANQRKLISRGGKMLAAIIIVDVVGTIVNSIISGFSLLAIIITILFIVGIMKGKTWVRYLYAAGNVLSIVFGMVSLVTIIDYLSPPLIAFLIAIMVWRGICAFWLFSSKSIEEYLYYNNH